MFSLPKDGLTLVNICMCVGCSCICTSLTVILPALYRMKLGQVFFMNVSLKDLIVFAEGTSTKGT